MNSRPQGSSSGRADLHKERMTEKLTRTNFRGRFRNTTSIVATIVLAAAAAGCTLPAQAQQPGYSPAAGSFAPSSTLELPPMPSTPAYTPNGSVVEDAVARVNDQIITRSEYKAAEEQLLDEAKQQNISQTELDARLHDLLRDLIDEQLLLSKGKELGITGDAETMRELDDIRKKNNLASMEDLQKAAAAQGVSFEDFKQHIRDQIIRQQVVRDEVGRHLNMTHAQEEAYYQAHAQDLAVPEQVHLSEILVPTPENATPAQVDDAKAKADALAAKLKSGEDFAALAKTSSGGPTAAAGGDLGDFKRGTLGDVLEKATFSLPAGGNTPPIRTRQGYVILHVDSHQAAGVPPLSSVEDKVQEALYFQELQPALRAYLTQARDDAFLEVDTKDGFEDSGSPLQPTKSMAIAYTAYKAPPLKKKVLAKQRVEQEKANRAQAELAAARERVAAKQAARAERSAGKASVKDVSKPEKKQKVHREKIRYGEAPRKSLPKGVTETASTGTPDTTPGMSLAPTDSITSITTGTGATADVDPYAPAAGSHKKVRFSAEETKAEEAKAKEKLKKAEAKASARPILNTATEDATEKREATALGLNGDTTKKPKKRKHVKGETKERFQEPTKPSEVATPVAPTVNPDLATPTTAPSSSTPQ
jgi:peptidyl-prolyl cis-trans isomerase SurA